MQCTGTSKRSGKRCKKDAMVGKEVCHIHGGKTPTGAGSPHFRHGRRSKDLPARLSERYEEALADEMLTEMRDEIALLDARLSDVLMRVDHGESGRWIKEVRSAWKQYTKAEGSGDEEKIAEARGDLAGAINAGMLDYAAWEEVYKLLEQRRRLAESERRRIADEQQMIPAARVLAFVGALVAIVNEVTPERDRRARIASKVARLVHTDVAAGSGGNLTAVGGG